MAVAVLPRYFEEFYGLIGRSSGNLYALVRSDGVFLTRYPEPRDRLRSLDPTRPLRQAIAQGLERAMYTVSQSQIDKVDRRVGYRKLEGFPIYAVAGIDDSAIRAEWLATLTSHLIFGLPATLLLFAILGLALQRTRRLHDEAERREAAGGRAAAGPASGSDRTTDRRRRARLQQPVDDRERQRAALAPRADGREAHAAARHDHECDRARREPHAAAARVLAAADADPDGDRSQPASARAQGDAQPLAARRYRDRGRRAQQELRGQGRSERARAGPAQSRR